MHECGQSLPEGFQKELVLDVSHFSPQTLRCGQVDPEREGRAEVSASFPENRQSAREALRPNLQHQMHTHPIFLFYPTPKSEPLWW